MAYISIYIQYFSQIQRIRPQQMESFWRELSQSLEDVSENRPLRSAVSSFEIDEKKALLGLELMLCIEKLQGIVQKYEKDLFAVHVLIYSHKESNSAMALKTKIRNISRKKPATSVWVDKSMAERLDPWCRLSIIDKDWMALQVKNWDDIHPVPFWNICNAQSKIVEVLEALPKNTGATSLFVAEMGIGVHWIIKEAVLTLCPNGPPLMFYFNEFLDPFYCIAIGLLQESKKINYKNNKNIGILQQDFEQLTKRRLSGLSSLRAKKDLFVNFAAFLGAYAQSCHYEGQIPYVLLSGLEYVEKEFLEQLLENSKQLIEEKKILLILSHENKLVDSSPSILGCQKYTLQRPSPESLVYAIKENFNKDIPIDSPLLLESFGTLYRDISHNIGDKMGCELRQKKIVLPKDLLELYYVLTEYSEFTHPSLLFDELVKWKGNTEAISKGLDFLSALALVVSKDFPVFLEDVSNLKSVDGSEHLAIANELGPSVLLKLYREIETKELQVNYLILKLLLKLNANIDEAMILEALENEFTKWNTQGAIDADSLASFKELFDEPVKSFVDDIIKSRFLLLNYEKQEIGAEADIYFKKIRTMPIASSFFNSILDLHRATWFYLQGKVQESSVAIKNSLIAMQNSTNNICMPRIYCQLALTEIARERLGDGTEYLRFAVEAAEGNTLPEELVRSLCLAAMGQYLWGNLAEAEQLLIRAQTCAEKSWLYDWVDWTSFFVGRVMFETGRYRRALDYFEELVGKSEKSGHIDRAKLSNIWRLRTLAHMGVSKSKYAQLFELDGDARLFAVEAAFMEKNYHRALELAAIAHEHEINANYVIFDKPVWDSGFDWIENRFLAFGGARKFLLTVFESFALAKIGDSKNSLEKIRKLVKEEHLSELNVYDGFATWVYSQCLFLSGAGSLDYGTALSLAFNRFQRRSSRIDNIDVKRSFMNQGRWNAVLMQYAREANLV